MRFNLNNKVKVRLTGTGREILKARHEDLQREFPSIDCFAYPNEDRDGFSEWQLWNLMETFGPYMHLGEIIPFEADIDIP